MILRALNQEDGSTMPEVAVSLLLTLSVFLGGIYYINTFHEHLVMEMAAKEGARALRTSLNQYTAFTSATKELEIGNVTANVRIEGSKVIVSKNRMLQIPLAGTHIYNLETSADAHAENKVLYYNK